MSKAVTLKENGPILVPGNATYTNADGNQQTTPGKMFALCRCGASANKPFCDAAHKPAGIEGASREMVIAAE